MLGRFSYAGFKMYIILYASICSKLIYLQKLNLMVFQSVTNTTVRIKRSLTIKFNITYYIIGCLKEVLMKVVLIGMMF